MIIDVRGTGFRNKGAELMLHAVVEEMGARPEVTLAVAPATGSYRERARLGLLQKLAPARLGPLAGPAGQLLPRRLRTTLGVVTEQEIGAVLDASGYAYGDPWGPGEPERMAILARRWRRQGKRIVLLPQAFGPFRDARTRAAFGRVLDEVDLAFARGERSAALLAELGARRARVERAPDFTVAVPGRTPSGFRPEPGLVAVIPNCRMIDKGGAGGAYRPLLVAVVRHLRARGHRPVLLAHDLGADRQLAADVCTAAGGGIDVLHEPDPRALKGILGACHAVVASRYHALVGAMTQGVPALGTGWSHKYADLFAEFGAPDALCDVSEPLPTALARLDALLDGAERRSMVDRLLGVRDAYLRQTADMWRLVADTLGLDARAERPGRAGAPAHAAAGYARASDR